MTSIYFGNTTDDLLNQIDMGEFMLSSSDEPPCKRQKLERTTTEELLYDELNVEDERLLARIKEVLKTIRAKGGHIKQAHENFAYVCDHPEGFIYGARMLQTTERLDTDFFSVKKI